MSEDKREPETPQENGEKPIVLYRGDLASDAALLAKYKSSKALMIHAERIQVWSRAKPTPLNIEEALIVAGASMYYQLDPTLGEIQYWVSGTGERRQLTVMRGYPGSERHAIEAAKRDGTYLMPPRYYILSDNQKVENKFPPDALVIECYVQDYKSLQEYINRRTALADAKHTQEKIDELLGPPPAHVGIGVMTKEEMDQIDNPRWWHYCQNKDKNVKNPKTGKFSRELRGHAPCPDCGAESRAAPPKYSHLERTRKRAYVAAISKWRSRWTPEVPALAGDLSQYAIEGEWRDVVASEAETEEGAVEAEKETLFPSEPPKPPPPAPAEVREPPKSTSPRSAISYWPKHIIQAVIDAAGGTIGPEKAAQAMADSPFDKHVSQRAAEVYARILFKVYADGVVWKEAVQTATDSWQAEARRT